ncbi:MAG: DUF262 domain-containing protein [Candidatus Acidiferrales bacterium]
MKFNNKEHTIEALIGFFNQDKINLIPRFQRGTVWKLKDRKKLLVNMVQARPIPAIFLYKEAQGPQFTYNILDGKQRLESLLLFVGNARPDVKVNGVDRYFYLNPAKKDVNFSIPLDGKPTTFEKLDDDLVRAFREYPIPTIEIVFDESTTINEIVDLFIDINQQGVKVTRFQIVQARTKDKLFKQVFGLIAIRQTRRKKSKYYRPKQNSCFVSVMKRLAVVSRLPDPNSQVERMWERLTEIALFSRSRKYRAPVSILKAFITSKESDLNEPLSAVELASFRAVFTFLDEVYAKYPKLVSSKLATDQPQFYTLVTTLLSSDLMSRFSAEELGTRLNCTAKILDGKTMAPSGVKKSLGVYRDMATKQTTNPDRREKRQEILVKIIEQCDPLV